MSSTVSSAVKVPSRRDADAASALHSPSSCSPRSLPRLHYFGYLDNGYSPKKTQLAGNGFLDRAAFTKPTRNGFAMDVQGLENALRVHPLELEDKTKAKAVEGALEGLRQTSETVMKIRKVFESEMDRGNANLPSSLQMENTFVPELIDGSEEGRYMALDLGGTNLRVLVIELAAGKIVHDIIKTYDVPPPLRTGCGYELFEFLADCVVDFVNTYDLHGTRLPLGFTFSFPMEHSGLNVGNLVTWTKTFNCENVVGKDVVKLLQDALAERGEVDVEVIAILNDTTGTLVKGSYLEHDTAIGLILGTGSNACFLENAKRVKHCEDLTHGEKEIIVDVEWGAFGDNGGIDFIKTRYDRLVDEHSIIPGSFTFEKYISGKYLGEIVQQVLLQLADEGLLFRGQAPEALQHFGAFTTDLISRIEADSINDSTQNTEDILSTLGADWSDDDVTIVQHVCEIVSARAAALASVCLAALLDRMEKPHATIAVDGSLFKHHPRLRTLMERDISVMAPNRKFKFLLAEDGSGKGAGLVAAIAYKIRQRNCELNRPTIR